MISRIEAAAKVIEYATLEFAGVGEIVINDPYVIVDDNAWVFPFNTKEFLATGDLTYALISNNPVLVCKRTGCLHHYPASMSATEMLSAFSHSVRAHSNPAVRPD